MEEGVKCCSGKKDGIGVDVGTHSVKYAQVERRGRQLKLAAAAVVHRSVAIDGTLWMRSPPVSSANEFAMALKLSPFSGRDAACISPISVCDSRTVEARGETATEQRDSIRFELSNIHSVPAQNLHFDYWKSPVLGPNEFHVLCIADRWTNQLISDHREARLSCNVLDALPHSLTRAATMSGMFDPSQPIALFDWGSGTATFCVAVDEQPIYIRSLPNCGFAALEEKVADALDMDEVQARKLIRQFGVPKSEASCENDVQQVLDDILGAEIVELEEELLRTISFLRDQTRKIKLQHGLVFGAGARLNNVDTWLGERLGLNLKVWQLETAGIENHVDPEIPVELFGPAVALSSLAWEAA